MTTILWLATGRAPGCNLDCYCAVKHVHGFLLSLAMIACSIAPAAAQVTLTQGTNFSVDAAPDGRLAIDLLGSIWLVPANGGLAQAIPTGDLPVNSPQWSPDASSIIYQVRVGAHTQLRQYRFADKSNRTVAGDSFNAQHPVGIRTASASFFRPTSAAATSTSGNLTSRRSSSGA